MEDDRRRPGAELKMDGTRACTELKINGTKVCTELLPVRICTPDLRLVVDGFGGGMPPRLNACMPGCMCPSEYM